MLVLRQNPFPKTRFILQSFNGWGEAHPHS